MSQLKEHVRSCNDGVPSGDFGPMAAAFAEDAELHFAGVPGEMLLTPRDGRIAKLVVSFAGS